MFDIKYSADQEKWNDFVFSHEDSNVFQTPQMAKVYENTKKYEPLIFTVIDENGEILTLLVPVIRKVKEGFFNNYTARSVIQGGPLYINNIRGFNAANALMQYYDEFVKKKALFTEIRMQSKNPQFDSLILKNGYIFEDHFNAIINLKNRSIEDLWGQIKRDKKRGIQKAEKSGLIIEECTRREDIQMIFKLISETYNNARVPLSDISLFYSAYDILVPIKMAQFLVAKYKDEYIATQIALMYKKTIYAWYTGTNKEYSSYHPGDLLIWHLLKWGIENGYEVFDFGGGGTNNKNINLREYKARFGTEFPNYGRYKKIYSPLKMILAEKSFEIYRRLAYI